VSALSILCASLAALWLAASPLASANPHLAPALALIEEFREEEALRVLEQARKWRGNTPADLARVHFYSGLAHAGLAHSEQAISSFRAALFLDSTLELPPGSGPRVTEWWALAQPPGARRASNEPALTPAVTPAPAQALPSPPTAATSSTVTRAPAPPRWLALSLLGAGAACAAAGAIVGARAVALEARTEAEDLPVGAYMKLHDQAGRGAQTANLLFGVGAAAGVGGGVLFVMTLGE
jgi:hypothetical protein